MPLSQGQVLNNRYRIVKLLGQGGFGAVYRAWDITLNVPCAVKESFELSPQGGRQFLREAQILAGLRHPNLPRVTDYFALPGQGQYLVMDFVEGQDLDALMAQAGGSLPEVQALGWVAQACEALEYMHSQQQPVIHRDIKPANIKITPPDAAHPKGHLMLVDFGVAKVFDPKSRTTVGARAVTPGFSPHEQYGQTGVITDARTDIYALGATLYTLLTGQVPQESILRVVDDTLIPPHQLEAGISAQAEALILKAMQVNPKERYQTAAEFKAAVQERLAVLETHPPAAHPPAPAAAPLQPLPAAPASTPHVAPASPAVVPVPEKPVAKEQAVKKPKPEVPAVKAPAVQAGGKLEAAAAPPPLPTAQASHAAPPPAPTAQASRVAPAQVSLPAIPPATPPRTGVAPPKPSHRLPWRWAILIVGGLLILFAIAMLVLQPDRPAVIPAPSSTRAPTSSQHWVVVLSQGTSITRQAYWTSRDYSAIEAFVRQKWDQEYQITGLEYRDGAWTVVMSLGTEITRQVFWTSQSYSDIEAYIQGKLDEDYQITDMDYSDGTWAVVMSLGTALTRQVFWHSNSFSDIETYIRGKWAEGYQVTDLEYSDGVWAVVLSQGTPITIQDIWYTNSYADMSAYIQEKWTEDYDVTELEYSAGLWVVVLSQGTPITRQVFFYSGSYNDMEAYIQAKLDEDYQITNLSR